MHLSYSLTIKENNKKKYKRININILISIWSYVLVNQTIQNNASHCNPKKYNILSFWIGFITQYSWCFFSVRSTKFHHIFYRFIEAIVVLQKLYWITKNLNLSFHVTEYRYYFPRPINVMFSFFKLIVYTFRLSYTTHRYFFPILELSSL